MWETSATDYISTTNPGNMPLTAKSYVRRNNGYLAKTKILEDPVNVDIVGEVFFIYQQVRPDMAGGYIMLVYQHTE